MERWASVQMYLEVRLRQNLAQGQVVLLLALLAEEETLDLKIQGSWELLVAWRIQCDQGSMGA